jgi:2-polyprenyl-3-methyl-5-hydroxy-6-metoxy-1,4-benzoquinol methylase
MENRRSDEDEHETACARVAAQFSQLWLRTYAGSKLRRDPIYPAAYELLRDSNEPILDLGCGVGLLAFYLRERGCRQSVLGLDLDARKIGHGQRIAQNHYEDVNLRCQDVQQPLPDFSGNVVLFDVLHYLPLEQQTILLTQLAERIAPGGMLIIRDCPRDNGPRFWMTYLAEKFAQIVSWNLNAPLHFPSRARIGEAFTGGEFESESRPLWGKSPFNNYLFIFRRRARATAPAAE